MARCERSESTFMAAVDERLTDEERTHAAGCADCAAAVHAALRFAGALESAAVELAGPALPSDLLSTPAGSRREPMGWTGRLSTATLTLAAVGLALVIGWQAGVVRLGGAAPDPGPASAPHTLHVLLSNHRRQVITVVAETTVAGVTTRTSLAVDACRGAYFAIPLGETWQVTAAGVLLGTGPPSPVSTTASGDLTLRVSFGVSARQILEGTPADNGLDPTSIVSTDLAPCR